MFAPFSMHKTDEITAVSGSNHYSHRKDSSHSKQNYQSYHSNVFSGIHLVLLSRSSNECLFGAAKNIATEYQGAKDPYGNCVYSGEDCILPALFLLSLSDFAKHSFPGKSANYAHKSRGGLYFKLHRIYLNDNVNSKMDELH
jgi:hypothetical protein